MSRRAVLNTAAASYVQMGSVVLAGLVSVPLALKYLDTERMGLWSFTMQSLGYLLLLDFGVSSSAGRLLGEPVHTNDPREYNRWLSLFTLVLTLQGLLILLAGYLSVDWILNWFAIKDALKPEARSLWLWMLWANALTFPLRVYGGILYAQNRSYWTLLSSALGTWVGLLGFFLFLRAGTKSLAYGYSSALLMAASFLLPWLAVKCGPQRFKISFRNLHWGDLKSLFNFSSGVFLIGLAVQVIFFSQTLVITKLLGLSAVTLFMISTKAGTLGLQILWRTFDAFNARWQQLYVAGDHAHLAASFKRYTGLVMSLAILGGTFLVVLNHPFVNLWAKSWLYGGGGFDLLLAIYLVQHAWNHCLAFCPMLAKKIRPMTGVAIVDMILNIVFSVLLVKLVPAWGVKGVLAGGIIGSSVSTFYLTWYAPGYFSLTAGTMVKPFIGRWLILGVCAALAFICFRFTDVAGRNLWLRGMFCVLAVGLFIILHRSELAEFLGRAKRFGSRMEY